MQWLYVASGNIPCLLRINYQQFRRCGFPAFMPNFADLAPFWQLHEQVRQQVVFLVCHFAQRLGVLTVLSVLPHLVFTATANTTEARRSLVLKYRVGRRNDSMLIHIYEV